MVLYVPSGRGWVSGRVSQRLNNLQNWGEHLMKETPNANGDLEEPIDLESYARRGESPPKAKRYKIRVDKTIVVVNGPAITGRQILEAAGRIPPERYRLDQKLRGGETRKIELTTVVDLSVPGIERFMTIPLDQTEG